MTLKKEVKWLGGGANIRLELLLGLKRPGEGAVPPPKSRFGGGIHFAVNPTKARGFQNHGFVERAFSSGKGPDLKR
jgi:hypothetical protein